MNDKLLIASKYKKTIEYILKITDNYPHRYLDLKSNISCTCFDILENIYIGNINKDEKKLIIPKINMLDYYLKLSYKYDVITKRKYEVVSNYLLELTKMIIGWINEENK